jgi:hypothetical protein
MCDFLRDIGSNVIANAFWALACFVIGAFCAAHGKKKRAYCCPVQLPPVAFYGP